MPLQYKMAVTFVVVDVRVNLSETGCVDGDFAAAVADDDVNAEYFDVVDY